MEEASWLAELEQELGPASAAWVLRVLELEPKEPGAERLRERALTLVAGSADLKEQAETAAARGAWREAGVLWQQLLRPKRPGSK